MVHIVVLRSAKYFILEYRYVIFAPAIHVKSILVQQILSRQHKGFHNEIASSPDEHRLVP